MVRMVVYIVVAWNTHGDDGCVRTLHLWQNCSALTY